jgi:hypothetical protein
VAVADRQRGDEHLAVGVHVAGPRQRPELGLDLPGHPAEFVEILAEDVDRDGRGRSRKDVTQPMLDRLPDVGGDARDAVEDL